MKKHHRKHREKQYSGIDVALLVLQIIATVVSVLALVLGIMRGP